MWLILLDVVVLIGLVIMMVRMKKNGNLTPVRFSLFNSGYWSFVILTAMLSSSPEKWQEWAFGGGIIILEFALGYPLGLWFYRTVYQSRH